MRSEKEVRQLIDDLEYVRDADQDKSGIINGTIAGLKWLLREENGFPPAERLLLLRAHVAARKARHN